MKKRNGKRLKTVVKIAVSVIAVICILLTMLGIYINTDLHRDLENIQGVNLGSWLVLERWMTPEVFKDANGAYDEYTLARKLPADEYAARIKEHRSSFITEADFESMAKMGVNTVRIPIPYYIFGDRTDEPYIACIDELDNAMDWAEANGIRVIIDMHMVPGSQNGFDNGGISGVCTWAEQPEEVEYVLDVLERLAKRYSRREGLLGIQPLNEPIVGYQDWKDMDIVRRYRPVDDELLAMSKPISFEFLECFYLEAYDRLHPILSEDQWIFFHDAFKMWHWVGFFEGFEGVAWDTHVYLFNMESVGLRGPFWHTAFAWGNSVLMRILQKDVPMIVGEWNLFNYYAIQDIEDSAEREKYYTYCADMQLDLWERCGAGHLYWNYRLGEGSVAERNYAWELCKSVEYGWISLK